MLVRREFGFEAAHFLTRYRGGPEPLHGHSWKLVVTLEGRVMDDGMVFDFLELGRIVEKEVLSKLHHRSLNDVIENPSAENVAIWAWERLASLVPLREIEVFESPGASVVYAGPAAERPRARKKRVARVRGSRRSGG
jgi:6-pyruvoyltetrahydropterin/6-carboxytetrahydropterin synthase